MPIQVCPKCGVKNRVDERTAAEMQPVCGKCGVALPEPGATSDGKPQIVSDATFARDVIAASSSMPVLVDARGRVVRAVRMIAPVLNQLAAESTAVTRSRSSTLMRILTLPRNSTFAAFRRC